MAKGHPQPRMGGSVRSFGFESESGRSHSGSDEIALAPGAVIVFAPKAVALRAGPSYRFLVFAILFWSNHGSLNRFPPSEHSRGHLRCSYQSRARSPHHDRLRSG